MSSNATRNILTGTLVAVVGVLLIAVGFLARVVVEADDDAPTQQAATVVPTDEGESFEVLSDIYDILKEDFVEPDRVDPDVLLDGAVNGLFQALGDPHSTYVSPDDFAVSRDDFQGSFQGIGATISQQDNFVVIVRALPDTPAERAGLQSGDVLLEVDGESAEGWSVQKAVLRIRGPQGTTVTMKIRHSDGQEETLSIVRDDVLVASVTTEAPTDDGTLRDADDNQVTDLGYVRISHFTQRTPIEVTEAVDQLLEANPDLRGLILDLRSNPGGLLVETAQTADLFLEGGIILVQVDRDGTEREFSAQSGTITDLPIVILQDEFSASGSEVLAAALAENGRATIVGTKSFGKGTVNHARELPNGGAVYVSIARWLTPQRNQIEGLGIRPDVEVNITLEDIEAGRDVAMYRAIDVLRADTATLPS